MRPSCKQGDVVVIDQGLVLGGYGFKKYAALVLWDGFTGQPLITRLDRWIPHWSTYGAVERVVGHVNLENIVELMGLEEAVRDAV